MENKIVKYVTGFPLRKTPRIRTLNEATAIYPLSEEEQEVWTRQGNTRAPISSFQRHGKSRYDLTKDSKILVFIDGQLGGIVRFRRMHAEQDYWAGYTKTGVISAEVSGKKAEREWCHWENFPIRWKADCLIREEILGESMEGISYRKRLKS